MKTLHKFIIKSYLGPFILTFFISIFILLMQFVWKYVDDLVGKGFEWHIIAKLLFYAAATLVPLALPLTILLSSIMTFGNFGEHYELVALKSSGLSLQRIMLPLTVVSILISVGAFFFSNKVLPKANLKMGSLLYDVRESKAAFKIKEGVFYNGIDGYSLRVEKKGEDEETIKQILIYDHTQFQGNNKVLYADSGRIAMTENKSHLILSLYNGHSYEEVLNTKEARRTRPLIRNTFKEHFMYLDMSEFKLSRTDENLFKDNYQMLSVKQLQSSIDSMQDYSVKKKSDFYDQVSNGFYPRVYKYLQKKDSLISSDTTDFMANLKSTEKYTVLETASNIARSAKAYTETVINELKSNKIALTRHEIEWHKKFTLSFACLVLFFIGAPLGAIIRKGGLGMPVVVSVIFFIIFHVISITGEKSAKEGVITPLEGMWLSAAILLPVGIFLTYKASTDSAIFDLEAYLDPIRKIFKKRKSQ